MVHFLIIFLVHFLITIYTPYGNVVPFIGKIEKTSTINARFAFAETRELNADKTSYVYNNIYTDNLTGKATLIPVNGSYCTYDWYITKVTAPDAEVAAKIGLKFDNQTVTYDPELLKAYIEKNELDPDEYPTVTVELVYMSIAGYVKKTTASFSFAKRTPKPEKVETIKFEWASDTIKHQASPKLTDQTKPNPQVIKVDLKDAFAAWGITAKNTLPYYEFEDLFEGDEPFTLKVNAYYYASDDDFAGTPINNALTAAFDNAGKGFLCDKNGTFAPSATLTFAADYWTKTTPKTGSGVAVDLIGQEVFATIQVGKVGDDGKFVSYYEVNDIPVAVSEPDYASFFTWAPKTIYVSENTKSTPHDLKPWLTTKLQNVAVAPRPTNLETSPFYFTHKKDAQGRDVKFAFCNFWYDQYIPENATYTETIKGVEYRWTTSGYAARKYNETVTENGKTTVKKPVADLTFKVVSIDEGGQANEFALNFTPAVTLKRQAQDGNYWFATNSAFEDAIAGTTYMGTFTLTGENGNKIALLAGGAAAPTPTRDVEVHPNGAGAIDWIPVGSTVKNLAEGDETKYYVVEDAAGEYKLNADGTAYVKHNTGGTQGNKCKIFKIKMEGGAPGVEPIAEVLTTTSKYTSGEKAGQWNFDNSTAATALFKVEALEYTTKTGKAYGLKIKSDADRIESEGSVHVKVKFNKAALKYASTNGAVADDPVVEFDINFAE